MRINNFMGSLVGKQAIRDSSMVVIDQGMMSLATFITGVLVARSIPREEYGIFVLGWSLIAIILGVQRALVTLPFTVYSPRMSPADRGRHLGSGFLHTMAIGLLSLLVFILIATRIPVSENNATAGLLHTLPYIALVILPYLLREQMRSAAIAQLDFTGSAKVNIAGSILILSITVLLYSRGILTLTSAYVAIAGSALLAGLLLLSRQWFRMQVRPAAFISDLLFSIRIGKWILLNVCAFTLSAQLFPWLILWLLDSTLVAAYGACLAVAGALNPLLRGINAYALPRMAHGYKERETRTLVRILWKTIAVLAIPFAIWVVLGSIFAESLMSFFYANKYQGYGTLVSLLIIKTVIEGISTPLTSAIQALEHPEVTTASLAVGALVSVIFGILLISEYSLVGAGIAALCSSITISAWKVRFIYSIHKR